MDEATALFEIANALETLGRLGLSVLVLGIAAGLVIAAVKLESGYLYILSTGALLLAAIYWLTEYQDVLGVGFAILLAGGCAYAGYRAWEYYFRRH